MDAREKIAELIGARHGTLRSLDPSETADAILALDEIQKWKRAYDEQVEMDRKLGHAIKS